MLTWLAGSRWKSADRLPLRSDDGADVGQPAFGEPEAGKAAVFDEGPDGIEFGMGGKVAVEEDGITAAAAGTADETCVVAGKRDVTGTDEEHLHAGLAAGSGDGPVVGDDGIFVDYHGAAFGVALTDIDHGHCSRGVEEPGSGYVQAVYEKAARAGGVESRLGRVAFVQFGGGSADQRRIIMAAQAAVPDVSMVGDSK